MSEIIGDCSMNTMNDMKKFSALLVDDDVVIRTIAKQLLDIRGFETMLAENGQCAVNIFKEGNSFDVVFMDMEMPVLDGIQATKELRDMGIKSLIFGVSSSNSDSDIRTFLASGLDGYFRKPLNKANVDNILKQLQK